tara:strand:- start:394 stop:678 length:285 start_codon:yes stop_codon:yes gene_type:complete
MEGYSYFELTAHLAALNEALLGDPDYQSRIELEALIDEVKDRIKDYDLSDDDLFECASCSQVFDNDDSNQLNNELHCHGCMTSARRDTDCGTRP